MFDLNVHPSGTSVIQVTATDADDSMYGNSAKLVYSISQGHPYFSVDPNTGWTALNIPVLYSSQCLKLETGQCIINIYRTPRIGNNIRELRT